MESLTTTPEAFQSAVRRIRAQYQHGLVRWLRGAGDEQGLQMMGSAFGRLEELCSDTAFARLWWLAGQLIAGPASRPAPSRDAMGRLLAQLDREMKVLSEGKTEGTESVPPPDLLDALLHRVAGSDGPEERQESMDQATEAVPLEVDSSTDQATRSAIPPEAGAACTAEAAGHPGSPRSPLEDAAALPSRMTASLEAAHAALARMEQSSSSAHTDTGVEPIRGPAQDPVRSASVAGQVTHDASAEAVQDVTQSLASDGAASGPRDTHVSSPRLLSELADYAGEMEATQSRLQRQFASAKTHVDALDRVIGRLRRQLGHLEGAISEGASAGAAGREGYVMASEVDPIQNPSSRSDGISQSEVRGEALSRRLAVELADLGDIRARLADLTQASVSMLGEQQRLNEALQVGLPPSAASAFTTDNVLLVQLGDETLAIPVIYVDGILSPSSLEKANLENEATVYHAPTQCDYPLVELATLLGETHHHPDGGHARRAVILVHDGPRRVAMWSDGVVGREAIVAKPVGPPLTSVPWVAGAALGSTGRPVVILDIPALLRSH